MRTGIAAAVCVGFLVVGCSRNEVEPQSAAMPRAVLGVVWAEDGRGSYVARLDPRSLEPLPGPRAYLSVHGGPWALSPDGSQVAFQGSRSIRIIDLKRMRVLKDIPNGRDPYLVGVLSWPEPRRLLLAAGMNWERGVSITVVDPVAGQVLSRRLLGGSLQDHARTEDGFVLLLGAGTGIGPARLAVVSGGGAIRTVDLARVPAGFRTEEFDEGFSVDHFRTPGVAVDPRRARAFVVWTADQIAEIDLGSLRVTYHAIETRVSFLGRLRNWLEPQAEAKGASDGSVRRALWLGNGLLAVSGFDDVASFDAEGHQKQRTQAAGLRLLDTENWSIRTLEPAATFASRAGDLLLAFGSRWNSETGSFEGAGLSAFDRAGEHVFHLFDDEPVGSVDVSGSYGYVTFDDSYSCRGAVVDLRAGKLIRELDPDIACNLPSLLASTG